MTGLALIVGGAGFVGSNLAHRLLASGTRVRILDNLSRPGVERNLAWLEDLHGGLLEVEEDADVRDPAACGRAARGASAVFHLAAQVDVTTSLVDPVEDFEVNARGTLNVLEAVRAEDPPPFVLFTSTNKVYGGLDDVALVDVGRRYVPEDPRLRRGIPEPAFHGPYGCSQRWYVSDPSAFGRLAGWRPRVGVAEGVARLHAWLAGARSAVPAEAAEARP